VNDGVEFNFAGAMNSLAGSITAVDLGLLSHRMVRCKLALLTTLTHAHGFKAPSGRL
jgi:hypothetical protein